MGRGEIDVWVVGVVSAAPLAVGVVGGGELGKVPLGEGVDSRAEHADDDEEEEDETAAVGA